MQTNNQNKPAIIAFLFLLILSVSICKIGSKIVKVFSNLIIALFIKKLKIKNLVVMQSKKAKNVKCCYYVNCGVLQELQENTNNRTRLKSR